MNRRSQIHISRWLLMTVTLLSLLSLACRQNNSANSANDSQSANELTVSAAASLREAFQEIAKLHQSHTGVRVNLNFGGSGALQKQIETGAPVDVFASAGNAQMDALATQSLIVPQTRRDFAGNSLVLVVLVDSSSGINDFHALKNASIVRLAIGNPKTVPAGQYAEQSLTRLGLWQRLQQRLILAEDVRQVLDYVKRGEVDAGIVYASDVRAAENQVRNVATAPPDSHNPILYPVAVVRASNRQKAANAFIETVISNDGQRILESCGFERVR